MPDTPETSTVATFSLPERLRDIANDVLRADSPGVRSRLCDELINIATWLENKDA